MQTTTETETETQIDVGLLKLIAEYHGLEKKARSKYLPLVEKAIELFEKEWSEVHIITQFRMAFAQTLGLDEKAYNKDPEYATFRRLSLLVVAVAKRGNQWYSDLKKKEVGFYRMYELATQVDDNPQPKKTKPAPASASSSKNSEEAPPEKKDTTKVWISRCEEIAKNQSATFIKMISKLVDGGLLPDTILPDIKHYMRGE